MQPTNHKFYKTLGRFVPNPGSVIFTLLIVSITLWVQNAGAILNTTIPHQGYLTDSNGQPLSSPQEMTFSLYTNATGGQPIWTEQRAGDNAVQLDNGLFHVMLGDVTSLAKSLVNDNELLYLGIAIGNDDEMTPRIELIGRTSNVTSNTRIKSGEVGGSINDNGWTLLDGEGQREYPIRVEFDEPFAEVPNVSVSLSRIDIVEESSSYKLYVYKRNVTQSGFDLVFRTWGTSKVYRADATWTAYTSP